VTIADSIKEKNKGVTQVFLCGGGTRNRFLRERISHWLPDISVGTTMELGIDPQLVESAAFAWLAHQTLNKLPGNIPTVTGAKRSRILGAIHYP
jgi:anhydro-N-acetylmuramic acid kinase